jgi:disulfide bond formation protein DsbB
MDVQTVSFFFALLALLCLAGIAAVAGLAVAARVGGAGSAAAGALATVRDVALPLAWVVALVATLGSLYYSQVQGFVPCVLCWYQRICMYPLAVILGVATFRRDVGVRWYALPLAVVGAGIAAYHAWIQAFPPVGGTSFCTAEAPCTDRYVWELGFVSLPFMALCGFLFVIVMVALARPAAAEEAE